MNGAAVKLVKENNPKTFRITSRRLDKSIETTSQKINEEVGAKVLAETGVKVDLKNPELEVGIDVTKKNAYIHIQTIQGPGGLPVGVSSRVVCLLSGGIDSPVAAWLMMKRGCSVTLLHFLHEGKRIPSKIRKLYNILGEYDPGLRLAAVPASELEREIIAKIPAKYRIIALRMMFLKTAGKIMKEEKAHAIVTGDNIGQVASQTLENMEAMQSTIDCLVLRPLACMDKQEVIDFAKGLGTYDVSILPYVDCCSFLLSKHPETRAGVDEVLKLESRVDSSIIDRLLDERILL
jgi:thiamine biosynthesis protein ThiI